MDIRPCEGVRSESDSARPAAICRSCAKRVAWQRGERDRVIPPAAHYASIPAVRMSCPFKESAVRDEPVEP